MESSRSQFAILHQDRLRKSLRRMPTNHGRDPSLICLSLSMLVEDPRQLSNPSCFLRRSSSADISVRFWSLTSLNRNTKRKNCPWIIRFVVDSIRSNVNRRAGEHLKRRNSNTSRKVRRIVFRSPLLRLRLRQRLRSLRQRSSKNDFSTHHRAR